MNEKSSAQVYIRTPLIESLSLSTLCAGRKVFLKLENCQPCGSFKLRGVSKLCNYAKSNGFLEVVCSSGGNAGLATAYSAMQIGIPCHIVVPKSTPNDVIETIRSYGATVQAFGDVWEQANFEAIKRTKNSKTSFLVHPFDHPIIWEGHSTMIDEIVEDIGQVAPSLIVTCCGGGGMVNGIVEGVRKHHWQNQTKILAMESVGTDSFNISVKAGGKLVRLDEINSIVRCLGANEVSEKTIEYFNDCKPPILSRVVEDREAVQGCILFANEHKFLVGLACGTVLSAVYNGLVERILTNDEAEHEIIYDKIRNNINYIHNTDGPVIIIVCGGSEITFDSLMEYKKRFNV